MKGIIKNLAMIGFSSLALFSCKQNDDKVENFRYLLDEFADLKVIRYTIPGWEQLSLEQKEYVYHLAEAAKWGRDIYWDQNCEHNLALRKVLEQIITD